MLEPTPRPVPCRPWRRATRRGACLGAALVLVLSAPLSASALGEDGPFEFPAATSTVQIVAGAVTRIPLVALIEDAAEPEVDMTSARLSIPQDLTEAERALMTLGEGGRSLAVDGEGTWTLLEQSLVFTPLAGVDGPSTPVGLTVAGFHDTRSLPLVLTPEMLPLEQVAMHGSAGVPVSLDLTEPVPEGGSRRLELAGLPEGSAAVADGSRVIVPDQGTWQLSADGTVLTHTPTGTPLGRQVDPVRVVDEDSEGAVVRSSEVTLTVPIISDLDWSAPYGEDIQFVVGEGQQFVDPATLRLVPLPGEPATRASADGLRVEVPGQGTWTLDRDTATVRFRPESADVVETAPMGITGSDGAGAVADTALLYTAYPVMLHRSLAQVPGVDLQFDLRAGVRDILSDSLRFDPAQVPDGAELSADGLTLVVPGEGSWRIDLDSRVVVMTPEEGFLGVASPVGLTAQSAYADNSTTATLTATVAQEVPTLRDDEQRTAPGVPVTLDVLGNDTAGSGSAPLENSTLRIGSLSATNLSELENHRGTRLVVPDEGVYTVDENGAITFTPEEGFTGRTSPVTYFVEDSAGVPASASFVVEVDPEIGTGAESPEVTGINSLLVGLMPSSPATSVVFGTIVMLLLYGGGAALWIGSRLESDRRAWED
ncbi:Ig-like domain-containing protein [Brachybacterium sp. J144]|uniref:Ig-like domain-containing protein n=1 Tax=Brachybacterium sp. J144 TaxID=3116487 RepID=UPI002E779049|nr:Ig-like domain-containing protein [Brachybacterium sp. J144]MEE1650861.1 Ig-like domain-containing protein [Brachybacterium sp. J144]